LQKPISKIPAPFPPNPWLSFPDFPPENLFSQALDVWLTYDILSNPTGSWEPGGREVRHQPTFEGKPMIRSRTIATENENGENPGGTFLFLQKTQVASPDSAGPFAIRSVFRSKRFIIKPL
jgi:hypothetical protein